jgi:hypothetical protein
MSYDLQAEGDNGTRNSTHIGALPGFHDGLSTSEPDSSKTGFASVLRVDCGAELAVGIRGTGGDYAPGVVGDGGMADGPGVIGLGGGTHGTGVLGLAAGTPMKSAAPNLGAGVGVYGSAENRNTIGVYGENTIGDAISGWTDGGIGISGFSNSNRAAQFTTNKKAQMRLSPLHAAGPPTDGLAGDFFVLAPEALDGPVQLWFCTTSASTGRPAAWKQIA